MNKPSHPISRRKLLRGLVGFAGVGVVGTSVGGYVWSKHSSSALVQSAVTATASNQYRTLANFRPPPIAIAVAASGTAAGVVLTDCHKGTGCNEMPVANNVDKPSSIIMNSPYPLPICAG